MTGHGYIRPWLRDCISVGQTLPTRYTSRNTVSSYTAQNFTINLVKEEMLGSYRFKLLVLISYWLLFWNSINMHDDLEIVTVFSISVVDF